MRSEEQRQWKQRKGLECGNIGEWKNASRTKQAESTHIPRLLTVNFATLTVSFEWKSILRNMNRYQCEGQDANFTLPIPSGIPNSLALTPDVDHKEPEW